MMEKKTRKKRKNNTPQIILVILLSVVLAMLIGFVGVLHWLEAADTPQPTESVPAATQSGIETPYGALFVPEEWAQYLRLEHKEGNGNWVGCCYLSEGRNPMPLFEVLFADPDSNVVGYLIMEDGSRVSVSIVMHELTFGDDWTEEEKALVSAAQEAVNEIIGQLDVIDKNILDDTQKEDLQFQTPYCTVYYPEMWADSVRFEESTEDGYALKLIAVLDDAREIPLAELYFGKGGGFGIWSLQQENGEYIDVGLELFEIVTDDTWTDEDCQKVFSMQEDMNYLLGRIPIIEKIPDETVPVETETHTVPETEPAVTEPMPTEPVETEPVVTEPMPTEPEETEPVFTQPTQPAPSEGQLPEITISTPVAQLYYPAQWEPYLQVETETGDGCTAKFYGKVGSHAREHLFSITLDTEPGAFLGTIVGLDGKEYNVYVLFAEFDPDESWTEEDKNTIINMQEDINYLLERLLG